MKKREREKAKTLSSLRARTSQIRDHRRLRLDISCEELATVPRNSPAYVATIADAVTDAWKIVERVQRDQQS